MDAARNLIPSPRNLIPSPPPFSTDLFFLEHANSSFTSVSTSSSTRYFPTSVLVQEQREECRPSFHSVKEDKLCQGVLDKGLVGTASFSCKDKLHFNQDMNDLQAQMLSWPYSRLSYFGTKKKPSQSVNLLPSDPCTLTRQVESRTMVQLSRKDLSEVKEKTFFVDDCKSVEADLRESLDPSVLVNVLVEKERPVWSLSSMHQKHSRKRRTLKAVVESRLIKKQSTQRKRTQVVDQSDPLRLFMSSGETKLLTLKEEQETIQKIQALLKLEKLRKMFQDQFEREPTLAEWAAASGLDCPTLKSELYSGQNSREKLIFANFRMVVHVAKRYQGSGVSLGDLLQEGSMGLMKSVEKFKPQVGCRFATYAFWWIRQAILKAVFHHSRTIRLPGNVYGLLSKVREAKRICVQEGLHQPTKEQVASCAGISVDKLNKLLYTTRLPLSIQEPLWADESTTSQEVTADPSIEVPDVSVSKNLMRQYVRSLLNVLSHRERKIIQARFGIKEGSQKSLSEIGDIFGLSKERVRQLESRALYKLKQHLNSQGLGTYAELLF